MSYFKKNYKKLLVIPFALCLAIFLGGCDSEQGKDDVDPETSVPEQAETAVEGPKEFVGGIDIVERKKNLPSFYERESKNEAADEKFAPKVINWINGEKIQRTPTNNELQDGRLVKSWNNIYLDADNRGCNACHSLEDALEGMETFHGVIYFGYPIEQNYYNCEACHSFFDTKHKDSIHTLHNRSDAFQSVKGSCDSCHYIDDEGNYKMWDFVKYDVLRGIDEVAADDLDADFTWDQTTVTPNDKMYYKSPKNAPDEWLTDKTQATDELFENWTVKVTGEVDNPFEMTLPELIEEFGTETHLMKSHCTINGAGQPMVYQAEVTGVPIKKIMEYAKVNESVNTFNPIGDDGFCFNVYTDTVLEEDGLLVTEMNGEPIPADQGFPVAFWSYKLAAGNFTKHLVEINFESSEEAAAELYGGFTHPKTGLNFDKPNVGVLTATSGQIFEAGKPVHLEGFADAWDEPITQVDVSLDKGKTWKEFKIDEASPNQWVYWNLDFSNLEPSAYVAQFRGHSTKPDGTNRISEYYAEFLFHVQ
ncbi:MAG: molybdopterin-dependent oxidoreductase [Clostridium sp.]|nr:molybdopterin-dependent oxidoreductase [Clostridium sp.]